MAYVSQVNARFARPLILSHGTTSSHIEAQGLYKLIPSWVGFVSREGLKAIENKRFETRKYHLRNKLILTYHYCLSTFVGRAYICEVLYPGRTVTGIFSILFAVRWEALGEVESGGALMWDFMVQ